MKTEDFFSVIVNPIWKWVVGIFMGVLSLIVYLKPEWSNRLSFSNLIQEYWWVWIVIGSFILVISTAWEAAKKIGEIRKASENLSSSNRKYFYSHRGNGDIVGGDKFDGDKVEGNKTVFSMNGKKKDIESEKIINEVLAILSLFENKFEKVRNSSQENILNLFKETEIEIHKIGTAYLPKIELILDNSEQLIDTFNDLFRNSNIYGHKLQKFLSHIQHGKIGEDLVIQEQISLQTDNGRYYLKVKKQVRLFRQQLKDRLP